MNKASRHWRTGVVLASGIALAGCLSSPPARNDGLAAQLMPVAQQGYTLQPGDVIRVSVWREPELDQVVLVRPDGGISFPLAGEIPAEGRTIEEVADDISNRLAVFMPTPEVTVSLQESDGNRIYVTGRVNKPGVFLVNRPVTVLQALSLSGGLTPFADRDGIMVLRVKDGAQQSIPFNYKDVQQGRSLAQNIFLEPGDTLIVP
jgi:polysaccharide biosynthesis/export protein